MDQRRRGACLAVVALASAAGLAGSGCLGEGQGDKRVTDRGRNTADSRQEGPVEVRTETYRSSLDDSEISALIATPRNTASRGCVIFQYGLGSTKEYARRVWPALAALTLTTVSIDFREHGARATDPAGLDRAIHDPRALAELIRGTVADLRTTVDHLAERLYCRRNLAYVGISLGGVLGAMLAAEDERVRAVAMIATPGTFRAVLNTPGIPVLPEVARDPARHGSALRTLAPLDPARHVGRIAPRPVLIMNGLDDETVLISNARRLQAAAREPKTIVNYRGGHDPAVGPDADRNARVVATFLVQTVVEPEPPGANGASGSQ